MTVNRPDPPVDPVQAAYASGRRHGLAIGALAMSIVAFISLLGVEKAILAFSLALLARRGAGQGAPARRLTTWAIALNALYGALFVLLVALYWRQFGELLQALQRLG
jgi:hypothetical protein